MHANVSKFFTLRNLLIVICFSLFITQSIFISRQGWSPIDEYAHFDYIEKIGKGIQPKISDLIEEEFFKEIMNNPERNPAKPVASRTELGLANYSYEAKHPPLYYIVLSIPNQIMKAFHFTIYKRLGILRIISFMLFTSGLLLLISICTQLKKQGYFVPIFFPYLCIAWSLLIITHERYGLGNNFGSPLLINASLLFLVQYMKTLHQKHLFLLTLFSGLSITCALTNVFILPFIAFFALPKFIKTISFKNVANFFLGIAVPTAMLIAWQVNSIPDPVVSQYITDFIQYYFKAGSLNFSLFLVHLLHDTFTIDFIHGKPNLSNVFISIFIINSIIVLFRIKQLSRRNLHWLLYCYVYFLCFVLLLSYLNRSVDEVSWLAFRHYLGFIPFIYIGFFSSLCLFKFKKEIIENEV